jgi:hypothetical protein
VVGYEQSEGFLSGTASAYAATAPVYNDGKFPAVATSTAPYTTRAVVEWLNVSGGSDAGPDWMLGHQKAGTRRVRPGRRQRVLGKLTPVAYELAFAPSLSIQDSDLAA